VHLNTHLSFDGNCEAAFRFYEEALGGKLVALMTYGESPMAATTPKERHGHVLHATLHLGTQRITGADAPGEPRSGFRFLVSCKAREAAPLFKRLSKGGRVDMPLQKTFWTKHFGMCVDRFGIPWMVSSE
jgi:PhnB protein